MAKDRSGYVFQDAEGKWFARTTVKGADGRRRNVKKRAESKAAAKELLKTLLRQIEEEGAKSVDFSRLTFDDLADYYEKHYLIDAQYVDGRKVAGLRSVDRPRLCVAHFRKYFGKRRLREITYGDVYAYRALRLRTPTIRYNRVRSIADVNRELSVLRRMLNIAAREGWVVKNPFNCGDSLISVADERRRERILTLDEERRLLEACDHPQRRHLRQLLVCLLDTGSRKGEMLKLRWKSVCFDTRVITIEGMTTKTLKTRHVAMTERVYRELAEMYAATGGEPEGLVFGIRDNFRNSFKSACKVAGVKHGGIDGLTIHSLRHTAATRLVRGQMPLQMVGRILGHSQPQTTYRYLSANAETAAQAAAILEAFQTQQNPADALADGLGDAPEESWEGVVELSDSVN